MPGNFRGGVDRLNRLIWTSDVDWNKGSLSNIEVSGTGDAATIRLGELSDNSDNIDFDTPGDYTLSDGTKVEVAAGVARLVSLSGDTSDFPFTTSGNYTFDSSDVEVTGGVAKLKLQNSAMTFFANYTTNINGNFGLGTVTGTATGGASVSGGKLDCTGELAKHVSYDANLNADNQQVGAVRFLVTPNYTGSPATTKSFISIAKSSSDVTNVLQCNHQTDGNIRWVIRDEDNVVIENPVLGAWSPTSGVEYEFEYNWDINAGVYRFFIDGVQLGTGGSGTGTRSSDIGIFVVGNNSSGVNLMDASFDNMTIFSSVQHTANYTPATELPFVSTDPTIVNNTGFVFAAALTAFTETSTKPTNTALQYQLSSDNGTTFEYWTGSTWADIQLISTPASVNTTVGTVTSGDVDSLQSVDANTYDVDAEAATPGTTIQFTFLQVSAAASTVTIHSLRDDPPAHVMDVEIWNFQTTAWDDIGNLPVNAVITQDDFVIGGTASDYIENEEVRVRLNIPGAGNVNHSVSIDRVSIDSIPANSWYFDNQSNDATVVNTNISTLAVSGTLKFKGFLDSVDGAATPELDRLLIAGPNTFSTTDNLYVETKDASQINPSAMVDWLTATFISTIPASTDVRVLFSVNDRVSWLTWSGSAWVIPASDTTRTDATSLADATTNFTSLPATTPLDVRVFIQTSDLNATPSLDNILITSDAGFSTSGNWQSNQFDSTQLNLNWGLGRSLIIQPIETTITILARAANTIAELNAASFVPLTVDEDAGVIGQFLQTRVEMTNGGISTPELDRFSILFLDNATTEISP